MNSRETGLISRIEETIIAVLLGLMALITFANVFVRYVFNSALGVWFEGATGLDLPHSILWGLEVVLILFSWLILFGIAYGFKVTAHLGVDALVNAVPRPTARVLTLIAAGICLAYAGLMLKGAWDYWAPFAGLDRTSGRWFPTGFEDTRDQAFYETEQVPIPFLKGWLEQTFNLGEEYEKLPRFIPYAMLPIGVALMLLRLVQATARIITGRQDALIVSHEAEEAVEDAAARQAEA